MSYPYRCPKNDAGDDIDRILYFSNPDVSFEGIPTGTEQENNARAIREDRDETSQRGTNCFTGFPEPGSPMGKNVCAWTEWTGFSEWGECCCEEDWKKCPKVTISTTCPDHQTIVQSSQCILSYQVPSGGGWSRQGTSSQYQNSYLDLAVCISICQLNKNISKY